MLSCLQQVDEQSLRVCRDHIHRAVQELKRTLGKIPGLDTDWRGTIVETNRGSAWQTLSLVAQLHDELDKAYEKRTENKKARRAKDTTRLHQRGLIHQADLLPLLPDLLPGPKETTMKLIRRRKAEMLVEQGVL